MRARAASSRAGRPRSNGERPERGRPALVFSQGALPNILFSVSAILLSALFPAQGAIAQTGAELARQCNACHGERGHSETEDIPSIAGFSMLATMDLLDTYRNGLRTARTVALPDGSETNMEEVTAELSDADEWEIVIHYANQKWQPQEQPFDADLARRGAEIHAERCERCHYDGGRDPESDLPIAAGQWRTYLEAEFRNFDTGRRAMSDKMKEKYDTLSAADKQAIIELYVSAGRF